MEDYVTSNTTAHFIGYYPLSQAQSFVAASVFCHTRITSWGRSSRLCNQRQLGIFCLARLRFKPFTVFTTSHSLPICFSNMDGSMRDDSHLELLSTTPQDCGPGEEFTSETQAQTNDADSINETHRLLPSKSMKQSASGRVEAASVSNMPRQSVRDQKCCATAQKTEKAFSDVPADSQWTPFVLRWYFVVIPIISSIVFAAVVTILYWVSHKNNGLCSEDSAMPGWKFVPTLIVVIYTQ